MEMQLFKSVFLLLPWFSLHFLFPSLLFILPSYPICFTLYQLAVESLSLNSDPQTAGSLSASFTTWGFVGPPI